MTAEEIAFYRSLADEVRQFLTIVVPAALTGLFAWLAGQRSIRLEIAKLKAEHEFAARSKYYDFLKEQHARVRDAYASLSRSMDEIVATYMKLLGQKEGMILGSAGDEDVPKMMDRLLKPALDTHRFILGSEVKNLRRERDNLLRYFEQHHPSEAATIEELRSAGFPSDEQLTDVSFEGVRTNTFRLKDIGIMMSSATSWVLHQDMEAQLATFLTKKK